MKLNKTLKTTLLITTAALGLVSTATVAMAKETSAFSLQGLSFEQQLAKIYYIMQYKYARMTEEEQAIFLDGVNRVIDDTKNPKHQQLLAAVVGAEKYTTFLDEGAELYNQGRYQEAFRIFKALAEQGYAGAQYNLGLMYYQGQSVAQDYRQAAKWYQKAAEQGIVQAQNDLGVLYYYGRGVKKNLKTAKKWYEKACNNGYQLACDNLRQMK